MVGSMSSNLLSELTDSELFPDEYKKTINHKDRGPGLSTSLMAIVSTELKLASDLFQAIADFLGPKYEESKKKGSDYVRQAQDKAQDYQQIGQDKAQELQNKSQAYQRAGHENIDEYSKAYLDRKEQAKDQASKTKEDVKARAGQK